MSEVKYESALPLLLARLSDNVEAALDAAADAVLADWISNAPVETGAYVGSMDADDSKRGERVIHDGVEYGIYLELGTVFMAARPDLTNAVQREEARFGARFEGILKP